MARISNAEAKTPVASAEPPTQDGWRPHFKVFIACGVMILFPFQYGVDFGLIGGLQAMVPFLKVYGHEDPSVPVGWNIATTRQQLITSLMTLGAFISSGSAGLPSAKVGRRTCLFFACILCVVANVVMMTTTSIGALYAGRFLIGMANGYFMTFSQLYIQETSPARYRGLFLSVFQFFNSFGTLIGTIVDWATKGRPDRSAYLIPLGVIFVVPVLLSFALLFIPESPRWLMLQGRRDEAVKSLKWVRPLGFDVDAEADEIQAALDRELETSSGVSILDMFRDPIDRRRTMISVGAVTLQAASGAMFIIAYKAYFFTMANVEDPFAMTNVLSTMGLLAIIINTFVIIRWGRRRVMLVTGLTACGILQLIIAIVYDKNPMSTTSGKVLVAISCLYMFSYNGMVATYAWLVGGETPSSRLRSHTFGLASAVGFFGAWLTSFTAPYFINPSALNWGPKYGYIWFPSCIIGAVWVFFFVPELRGRTLEEIDEMFAAKLPARKFRKYKCIGLSVPAGSDKSIDIEVEELEKAV